MEFPAISIAGIICLSGGKRVQIKRGHRVFQKAASVFATGLHGISTSTPKGEKCLIDNGSQY
jgi:hypothetical protein